MPLFISLSLSLGLATLFATLARFLKQPLIVGYLFAGLIVSFFGLFGTQDRPFLDLMAQLGVAFLLFLVGLEMSVKDLSWVGKPALIAGLGQILTTFILGFLLAVFLGFGSLASIYIAIALTFSSTILVVKLLSEKKDLSSLYGKISIGFLLVQDFVAILVLIVLSGLQEGRTVSFFQLALVVGKGVLLVGFIYLLSKTILKRLFDKIALMSGELLFIASVAWALVAASVAGLPQVGFSIEIGGFLAGVALANSLEHLQIASRVRPLRDFFITIFFLLLGAKLATGLGSLQVLWTASLLSLFVLVGNPLIILTIMGALGFKRRTSFLSSVTVAQISEFSFIIVFVGEKLGHITETVVGLVISVGVLTMLASSYLILHAERIYNVLKPLLGIFERRKTKESAFSLPQTLTEHIILLGADRTGQALLPALRSTGNPLLILDFNPQIVEKLAARGFNVLYGDVADLETFDLLNISQAKLVVSTINSFEDDWGLLERINKVCSIGISKACSIGIKSIKGKRPVVVVTASTRHDALRLYEAGATFVLVPQVISGEYLAYIISTYGFDKERFEKLKDKHFTRLAEGKYV